MHIDLVTKNSYISQNLLFNFFPQSSMQVSKKLILIPLLFLTSIITVFAQDMDCKKFRDGTFIIPKTDTSPKSTLIRKGNIQIETLEGDDKALEFIVKWIDDCTYTLTPTKESQKYFPDLPKDAVLTVQIIETKENSYVQVSRMNFIDFELTAEIFKVE